VRRCKKNSYGSFKLFRTVVAILQFPKNGITLLFESPIANEEVCFHLVISKQWWTSDWL